MRNLGKIINMFNSGLATNDLLRVHAYIGSKAAWIKNDISSYHIFISMMIHLASSQCDSIIIDTI